MNPTKRHDSDEDVDSPERSAYEDMLVQRFDQECVKRHEPIVWKLRSTIALLILGLGGIGWLIGLSANAGAKADAASDAAMSIKVSVEKATEREMEYRRWQSELLNTMKDILQHNGERLALLERQQDRVLDKLGLGDVKRPPSNNPGLIRVPSGDKR